MSNLQYYFGGTASPHEWPSIPVIFKRVLFRWMNLPSTCHDQLKCITRDGKLRPAWPLTCTLRNSYPIVRQTNTKTTEHSITLTN